VLTNGRVDNERLAKLIALLAVLDVDQPEIDSSGDVKSRLLEFERLWHVRAFLAENEILACPPNKSLRVHRSTFLDPIEDIFSQRLDIFNANQGPPFRSAVKLKMDRKLFAQVFPTGDEGYQIEIGLRLIVQLFLGAITLSQSGSKASLSLTNPYSLNNGAYTSEFLQSQEPVLQALAASAFRHLLPPEPWRMLLAYEIFSKALEFALLHEFAHAVRGHLKFLVARGLPGSRAAENGVIGGILPLTHQLLESQADDHAALFITYKWKRLTSQHAFEKHPLPLSRYGFCVSNAADAHRIHSYAFTLLFFVLDAGGRGAKISGISNVPTVPLYPSAAYRAWRALAWQKKAGVAWGSWLDCVEIVRSDLAEDGFPDANTIFRDELSQGRIEEQDRLLQDHSEKNEEALALFALEIAMAKSAKPQGMPTLRPVWGEKSSDKSTESFVNRLSKWLRRDGPPD
jgi:hypothetical protein